MSPIRLAEGLVYVRGRYQCELEQMRKTCRERFGPTASGTCPTCEKYIQVNLGMLLCTISRSYGAVRSPGARFGRGRRKTVWITRFREGGEFGAMVSAMDSHS